MIAAASGVFAISAACAPDIPEHELFLPATLVRVVDGDTLDVRLDSGPIKIRMHGIDTPERKQVLGGAATKALRSLVEGQPLEIEPIEQNDGYGRMVAKVFIHGDDINARMVDSGYAWAYRRYLRRNPVDERYCRLEAEARAAGRGVWVGPPDAWEPPWVYRDRQSGQKVPPINFAHETAKLCIAAIGRVASPSPAKKSPIPIPGDPSCRIKGNINSKGDRIYHVPGSRSYEGTVIDSRKDERWFCTVEEAEHAGWRAPK